MLICLMVATAPGAMEPKGMNSFMGSLDEISRVFGMKHCSEGYGIRGDELRGSTKIDSAIFELMPKRTLQTSQMMLCSARMRRMDCSSQKPISRSR